MSADTHAVSIACQPPALAGSFLTRRATTYSGRALACRKIRATYSPSSPIESSCTPPRKSTTTMTEVQPAMLLVGSISLPAITQNIASSDPTVTSMPRWLATRRGLAEKLLMPSRAKTNMRLRPNFVLPAKRASRSYGSGHCRKPTQLTSPRMYRLSSRNSLSTSTTARSISRKSPLSSGTGTSESRDSTR